MGPPADQPAASGLPQDTPRPLDVLVVGGGIGGLVAALGLRRQGHKVTILEQSSFSNEVGAAIHVASNANCVLRRLGVYLEKYSAVQCTHLTECATDGSVLGSMDRRNDEAMYGHPYHLMHRAFLHRAIKEQALGEEGFGTPCILKTSSRVVDVDAETGTVKLHNGDQYTGDLIIGADGIRSCARAEIPGAADIHPKGTGHTVFRFLIDNATLAANPQTAHFVERPGSLYRLATSDAQSLVIYPCQSNTVMNCMYAIPTSLAGVPEGGGWQQKSSKEFMLSIASPEFVAGVREILKMADDEPKLWELMDMDELPTWVTGKLALVGDAAHPFTPWLGQGGAMAMEDGASLAALLPASTKAEEVPERLRLYDECRRHRGNAIQDASRNNRPTGKKQSKMNTRDFNLFILEHDAWKHATTALRNAQAKAA